MELQAVKIIICLLLILQPRIVSSVDAVQVFLRAHITQEPQESTIRKPNLKIMNL